MGPTPRVRAYAASGPIAGSCRRSNPRGRLGSPVRLTGGRSARVSRGGRAGGPDAPGPSRRGVRTDRRFVSTFGPEGSLRLPRSALGRTAARVSRGGRNGGPDAPGPSRRGVRTERRFVTMLGPEGSLEAPPFGSPGGVQTWPDQHPPAPPFPCRGSLPFFGRLTRPVYPEPRHSPRFVAAFPECLNAAAPSFARTTRTASVRTT